MLRAFAEHVRGVRPDAFTVGEVFDSTGALLAYYPDQLHSYFAFEVADSVIAAVRAGSARGMLSPILRLQREVPSHRWSVFLRNHDQPRTLTELRDDVAGARLAAVLQFTLPGLPFVYYGEELGMIGGKPDERIRTPMAWTRGGPHAGFTSGTPWQPLQDDSLVANVEVQDADRASLLNLYRTLIRVRSTKTALATGELHALRASDSAVVAYVRRSGDSKVLIVANMGRTPVANVSIDSDSAMFSAGDYTLASLVGTTSALTVAPLRVDQSGAVRSYRPLAVLAPQTAYVLEMVSSRR